uniref:SFRICE_003653 n=1 Tax=Spodoptera frugiperda TaxID=7108 RepID=A0A2H1VNB3_SPOFR
MNSCFVRELNPLHDTRQPVSQPPPQPCSQYQTNRYHIPVNQAALQTTFRQSRTGDSSEKVLFRFEGLGQNKYRRGEVKQKIFANYAKKKTRGMESFDIPCRTLMMIDGPGSLLLEDDEES